MKLLKAIILVVVEAFLLFDAEAQDVFVSAARFQSMAGASTALKGCWSVFGNQAGLAEIDRVQVGGSFQNRFLVKELSAKAAIAVIPVQSNVFAVSFSQFGKTPFKQEKIGIAYARSIGKKMRFGLQFNRYGLFLSEENKTEHTFGLEVGSQYDFTKQFTVGLLVTNPYQTAIRLSAQTYRYDSKMNVGAFYRVSPQFGWAMEVENRFDRHILVKTGFECDILNCLVVRAGVAGKPYLLSAGFGFRLKDIAIDFATSYDQYLGTSPSVSLQYQF